MGQASAGLMEGDRGHIRAGIHRADRAITRMEIIMRAMGLIDQHGHIVRMGKRDYLLQIGNRPEIGWVDDEDLILYIKMLNKVKNLLI